MLRTGARAVWEMLKARGIEVSEEACVQMVGATLKATLTPVIASPKQGEEVAAWRFYGSSGQLANYAVLRQGGELEQPEEITIEKLRQALGKIAP